MIETDEDALICDLAETYHIYNYRQLPPTQVAVFSYGLREDSRIKMKLSGHKVDLETMLLARIADNLTTLVWFQTEDGQKGNNKPDSILDMLTGKTKQKDETVRFDSGEDFMKQRKRLLEGR